MATRPLLSAATLQIQQIDWEIPIANWLKWQDVFEHANAQSNPLLTNPRRFRAFVTEYSVARTIRKGEIDGLRGALRWNGALDFLNDPSGSALDEAELNLRHHFGTLNGKRGIRSALSRIAAFLKPDVFVAFDNYALVGVRRFRRHTIDVARAHRRTPPVSMATPVASYANYLRAMNQLLAGELGDDIRNACTGLYPSTAAAEGDRFHIRVLDIYLSRIGGRTFSYTHKANDERLASDAVQLPVKATGE